MLFLILVLHFLLRSILYVNRASIRDFARIRRHLCKSTAITLANALVTSRLDYCNSLLSSISVKDLNRLQGIQNTICRIICKLSRFSSTNCAHTSLHGPPVKQRIQFKNLLLTYKSLHTGLPSYLNSALVPFSSPFHSTRRSSPAHLILSTMSCNSSHTSKSQLNYSLITLLHVTGIVYQILFDWRHQF